MAQPTTVADLIISRLPENPAVKQYWATVDRLYKEGQINARQKKAWTLSRFNKHTGIKFQ